ncbi:MAG: polyprenyl synthetase family protein [Oscillospiraceae bacterium]|nr:polyprenyl synthetase family protein [Oscillospiraceae bacterium]MBR4691581.1 polyprenyl synthetase family protein [Oscillospiraceae bacterium]
MENEARLEADRLQIEGRLASILPQRDRLTEAMRYSLLAGGKRLRPILTLEFCRACGGEDRAALDAACGVELLHTYTLIHDDLPAMDDDGLRRGKPTNHVVYGEWLALLAGDALQAEAFAAILSGPGSHRARAEAAAILAEAAGSRGVCHGQFLDLDGEGRRLSEAEITALNEGKTGALISAACRIGCVCAERYELLSAAGAYGRELGLAFQLRDDLLDARSTTAELGKPVGSDEKNGKATLLSLYGEERCRELIRETTDRALDILRKDFGGPGFLLWLTEKLAGRSK